jgi:hypothetical protein
MLHTVAAGRWKRRRHELNGSRRVEERHRRKDMPEKITVRVYKSIRKEAATTISKGCSTLDEHIDTETAKAILSDGRKLTTDSSIVVAYRLGMEVGFGLGKLVTKGALVPIVAAMNKKQK